MENKETDFVAELQYVPYAGYIVYKLPEEDYYFSRNFEKYSVDSEGFIILSLTGTGNL
jgi:hypothetical protein